MYSKRKKRPNVRLGEIGDVSSAFACGVSRSNNQNLGYKSWKNDFVDMKRSKYNQISGFSQLKSCKFSAFNTALCPKSSADLPENNQNKNPSSSISASEITNWDEKETSKCILNFGNITRKSRLMKRCPRKINSNCNILCDPGNLKIGPKSNSQDGKDYGSKEVVGIGKNTSSNVFHARGYEGFPDQKTSCMSEEEISDPNFRVPQNSCQGPCREEHNAFLQSSGRDDHIKCCFSGVNNVGEWLDKLGFGNYANLFEKHEVDKEALPLLTSEDLKEMGIFAVGARRKLSSAIQQLRLEGKKDQQGTWP